jgi:hypothetical protein
MYRRSKERCWELITPSDGRRDMLYNVFFTCFPLFSKFFFYKDYSMDNLCANFVLA